MKIEFKLTYDQLAVWSRFLSHTYDKASIPPSIMGKLIKSIIMRMHLRLKNKINEERENNKINLTQEEGLAFLIHSEYWIGAISTPFEQVTINQIIATIHQKTI